VYKNGVVGNLTVSLLAGATVGFATQATGIDTFVAGDKLAFVRVVTAGADIAVELGMTVAYS
jgi:acyl dehydratase